MKHGSPSTLSQTMYPGSVHGGSLVLFVLEWRIALLLSLRYEYGGRPSVCLYAANVSCCLSDRPLKIDEEALGAVERLCTGVPRDFLLRL